MTEFRAATAGTAELPQRHVADHPPVLVGMSAAMDRLRTDVMRAAEFDTPVLITGEPGSGKSLVARAFHELGPRARERCAVIECQAFPETLLEVELFGCAKGGVTGASYDRQGVLEMASGGTVILENIEAVSSRTQASLGRFLASGRVQSVGTLGPGTPVNTRVVATSVQPPHQANADRWYHPTLRSVVENSALRVPSLRDRQADIPLLAQFFASNRDRQGGIVFSVEAMSALSAYAWPGNVTQLKSVVERLVERAGSGLIRPNDLPVGIRPRPRPSREVKEGGTSVGEELLARVRASGESFWSSVYPLFMTREITRADLRDLVRRALHAARGNADELVQILNMPRSDQRKFTNFLRKYGCEPDRTARAPHT